VQHAMTLNPSHGAGCGHLGFVIQRKTAEGMHTEDTYSGDSVRLYIGLYIGQRNACQSIVMAALACQTPLEQIDAPCVSMLPTARRATVLPPTVCAVNHLCLQRLQSVASSSAAVAAIFPLAVRPA
jgi:hypothetical protein